MGKRINLNSILVVDVEATCWERPPIKDTKEFTSEIIEVGICKLDLDKGVVAKESIIVKPRYSKVSEFCTKLTTLTQEQVDGGVDFDVACWQLIDKYDSMNSVWASYGDYDRNQFDRECRNKRIEYPFSSRHINVKNLFALIYRLHSEVGMPEALYKLGIPLEGTHHRGLDDALNIAKIAQNVLQKK